MGYYAVNYLAEYVNEMNKQLVMTQAILGAIGGGFFFSCIYWYNKHNDNGNL